MTFWTFANHVVQSEMNMFMLNRFSVADFLDVILRPKKSQIVLGKVNKIRKAEKNPPFIMKNISVQITNLRRFIFVDTMPLVVSFGPFLGNLGVLSHPLTHGPPEPMAITVA